VSTAYFFEPPCISAIGGHLPAFLVTFSLHMRRNCYFPASGQNADIWRSDDVFRCFYCTDRISAIFLFPVYLT